MSLSLKKRLLIRMVAGFIALMLVNVLILIYLHTSFNRLTHAIYTDIYKNAERILNADRDLYQARIAREAILHEDSSEHDVTRLEDVYLENTQQALARVDETVRSINESEFYLNSPEGERLIQNFAKQIDGFYSSYDRWLEADPEPSVDAFEKARNHLDQAEQAIDLYALETMNVVEKRNKNFMLIYLLSLLAFTITVVYLAKKYGALQLELQKVAFYDKMTGVPNRAYFSCKLEEALLHEPLYEEASVLLLLDCDSLQQLNETLGHRATDEYLVSFTKSVIEIVQSKGEIFRIGGDEFAILLFGDIPDHILSDILDRLMALFRSTWHIHQQSFYCTTSIGVARYPEHAEDHVSLYNAAMFALSQAKQAGGNHVVMFDDHIKQIADRNHQLQKDLNTALQNDEMYLAYQLQIDLESGNITGCEALIRWRHPVFGMLSPGEFIPVAEETGDIVAIGRWVLTAACRQNKSWLEQGRHWTISVNIAASHLHQSSFTNDVEQVLNETGLPGQHLKIELTESTVVHYKEEVLDKMNKLKKLGVGISIDDFGTGYSSLSYLKRFPIDSIKIDKSFIQDLPMDQGNAQIVQALIQMCHNLNIRLVAEGTETLEQVRTLRKWHCNEVQGYYFARPLIASELENHLASTQSRVKEMLA